MNPKPFFLFALLFVPPASAETVLMPGHVSHDSAKVWCYSDEMPVTDAIFQQGDVVFTATVARVDDRISVARVEGLSSDTETRFSAGTNSLAFRTPAPPANTGRLVIAVGSCNALFLSEHSTPIFRTIATKKPDLMLWLGDNWYYLTGDGGNAGAQDKETGALLQGDWSDSIRGMGKALRTRLHPDLRDLLPATSHYAIWDDHDFGYNNAPYGDPPVLGPEEQAKVWFGRDKAADVFTSMWANPDRNTTTPGTFYSFRRGPVAFFMMDDRYWKDVPNRRIWGGEQTDWLKRSLLEAQRDGVPVKIIANGTQVLISGKKESHGDEASEELDEILAWISEQKISGTLFLSGDRHRSELWQFADKGNLIEFTASPFFHGYLRDPGPENPSRLWVGPKANNFGLITVDIGESNSLTLEALDDHGFPLRDISSGSSNRCQSTFPLPLP